MFLFKQRILKEEIIKFLLGNACVLLPISFLTVMFIANNLILCLLITILYYLIFFLGCLQRLDWYEIYENKIIVKNIYKTKNIVYFRDVNAVYEITIYLARQSMAKQFLIFDDDRLNNNEPRGFWDFNKKKYNLKVYKTDKLLSLVKNLGFHISQYPKN
ncbi:MAG: hypothetical protein E7344_03705 [Clostridiales bacterium]|nr:hypothetical protein [Clostridiales bacterium]